MQKIFIASSLLVLMGSCSVTQDFYKRKYMPGFHSKERHKDIQAIGGTEKIIEYKIDNDVAVIPDLQEQEVQLPLEKTEVLHHPEKIMMQQPLLSLFVIPADTIPSQLYLCNGKELKQVRVWSTLCVPALVASWFLLPLIGGIAFFLIQFCIGALALILTLSCIDNKDRYLKVMYLLALISMVSMMLLGIFNLIYCTFIEYCG